MAKLTPKKEAQLCHKLIVLADLTLDTLDELGYDENHELYAAFKTIENNSCKLLEAAYGIESVKQSVYLGNLSNQVDTVIRKNFKEQS